MSIISNFNTNLRALDHCLILRWLSVLDLAKIAKDAVQKQGMLAWQYNTIGVSDAITMGGEGMWQTKVQIYKSNAQRNAIFSTDKRNYCRQY